MPPFHVGFAQVEDRLRVVRRRLNLLTLQHALYLSGSLLVLAITLVIAMALRGRGSWFAVAVWCATASAVAALAAAGLRVRQRWVSAAQVVHFADRQAALDDRLATLLLDPAQSRASSLKPLLLQQILDAAPRWDVDTLVPRRVPRSLFALLGSLAALIVIAFLVRPPAIPSPIATRSAPHPNQPEGDTTEAQPRPHAARIEGSGQVGAGAGAAAGAIQVAGLSGMRERTGAAEASKPNQAGGVSARAGQAAEHGAASVSADRSEAQVGDGVPPAADAPPRDVTDKLQSAIRNAFGADMPSERKPAPSGGGRQDGRTGEENPPSGDRSTNNGGKASPTNDATSTTGKPSNVSGQQPGAGSAPAAGTRTDEEGEQLFSSAAGARKVGAGAQNVSIRLGAFSALAPSQVEPQRHPPPIGEAVPSGASPGSQPPLADEQVADAPLQKAEVAPQHEALVRRIFTRDE